MPAHPSVPCLVSGVDLRYFQNCEDLKLANFATVASSGQLSNVYLTLTDFNSITYHRVQDLQHKLEQSVFNIAYIFNM